MRQNHQYLWKPLEPEVDLDFRGNPNMLALYKCQQWIPWPQKHKYRSDYIIKWKISIVTKTQSSVCPQIPLLAEVGLIFEVNRAS